MADQQSSDLLRVLGQLNDAAWAETLLPLLQANRSAGAVALACKQLRRLCHGNQRQLNLTGANCQPLDPLELDAFSRRFPACSSVTFTAKSTDDVGLHFTCVLPLLARLPNLRSLQLTIKSSAASQPAQMVPALQLLRLQLPQLRSLQLVLGHSWTSQQCWKMLGAATQLTKLAMDFRNTQVFDDDDDRGVSLQHLSALRPLGSGLQHLELTAQRIDTPAPQDCSFLSSFTSLSSLVLPLIKKKSGLAAISSCTALQQLALEAHGAPVLDDAEYAALAQLTRLTQLAVPSWSDDPALVAALRCLSGLQSLRLEDINSSHLPALATLTNLTSLRGSWVDTPADQATSAAAGASQHTCPSVADVQMTGPFPLAAFPGAREFHSWEILLPSRLVSISQAMKQLETITIIDSSVYDSFCSLDPFAPVSERVAAVRSLGSLPCLRALALALNDGAETAALGTVTQLQNLTLVVPESSSVPATGVASVVCRLSMLQAAKFHLSALQLSQDEALMLLNDLSGLAFVEIITTSPEQHDVWMAAEAEACAAGLPLPTGVFIMG